MKKIILLLISILIFASLIDIVFSAPMSWGVALSHETKECAGYWGGDEFTNYVLLTGWKAYYPEEEYFFEVNTSFGTCRFENRFAYNISNWRKCCRNLGFKFVDYNNFDKGFVEILEKDYNCKKYPDLWEGALAIDSINQECTLLSCRIGNAGPYKKYKNGLEIYGPQQQDPTQIIKTEIGECNFSRGYQKECCNQLGYTFVAQNIGKGKTTSWGMMEFLGSLSCLIFFPIVILLIIIFVVLKIKTKSFIPFLKSYSKKGLFIGAIIGLLCSLSSYSVFHFSGCGITVPVVKLFQPFIFIVYFIIEKTGVVTKFFDETSLFLWFFILVLNLIYFGLIGWALGLLTQKIRKK